MTTDRIRYSQPALIKRGHVSVDEQTDFTRDALQDIRAYMREHDLHPNGPPFAISTGTIDQGMIDVEAGWPIDHPVEGAGAIHTTTLSPTLARHTGEKTPID
jgi:hypothetical protein